MKFEATLEFEKSLKRLSKKYKSLKDDYSHFLDELEKNPYMGDETSTTSKFLLTRKCFCASSM